MPNTRIENLSGTFLTKVFEGPYRHIWKWTKAMEAYVRAKGDEVEEMYFFYSTCPKCAKQFGHNYVVLFAQVA